MSESILKLNPIKTAIIKAGTVSIEKNSKGESVSWLRLEKDVKESPAYIVTSKNNCEFAAKMPIVNLASDVQWLHDNQSLENVRQWLEGLYTNVNRPILAAAGAGNLKEAELIGDIESLIAFDTLESARGRKASRFDTDQWKIVSLFVAAGLKSHFEDMKLNNVQAVANKYLGIIRTATFNFAPMAMDDDTAAKIDRMIEHIFLTVVEAKPEHETLAAMLVSYWTKWKEVHMTGSDEY